MKRLAVTIITLLACQCLSTAWGTLLPLEVYELRSAAAAAATTTAAAAAAAAAAHEWHYQQLQRQQGAEEQQQQGQQHKHLEYATVDGKQQQQQQQQHQPEDQPKPFATQATTTTRSPIDSTPDAQQRQQQQQQQQLDRRRSRQIFDKVQQQQQQQQPQPPQKQHHFNHSTSQHHLHRAHRQQQQHHDFPKDIRILYQVGEAEEDLPVCAPNAVCSKIDLYESPWIERQCRCPSAAIQSTNIVLHHYNDNNNDNDDNNNNTKNKDNSDIRSHFMNEEPLATAKNSHVSAHNNNESDDKQDQRQQHHNNDDDKYLFYYEHENLLERKQHLLASDDLNADDGKHYENVHLKKLMQKLGAVFEDNLDLVESNDFLDANEDADDSYFDAPDVNELNLHLRKSIHQNQPDQQQQQQHHRYQHQKLHEPYHHQQQQQQQREQSQHYKHPAYPGAHMRHSGHHSGNRAKELSSIGGCPSGLGLEDGHTIVDKTRHYKLCHPVHKLPVCRHFRDYTWTLTMSADLNVTEQMVHCRCPRNSIVYLKKGEPTTDRSGRSTYFFVCSPFTRIRCQRKEPCKLFTVRKRQEFIDEVNITIVCQCPKGHRCPSHHTQSGVIPGGSYRQENIKTYSGYCMAND